MGANIKPGCLRDILVNRFDKATQYINLRPLNLIEIYKYYVKGKLICLDEACLSYIINNLSKGLYRKVLDK